MTLQPSRVSPLVLSIAGCLVAFAAILWAYGFPIELTIDLFQIFGIAILPGYALVALLDRRAPSPDSSFLERVVLGSAVGFGLPFLVWEALAPFVETPAAYVNMLLIGFGAISLLLNRKQISQVARGTVSTITSIIFFVLLWLAFYNLHQFQLCADGSIQTRQVFGTDLTFLIGEVHGIRNFPGLRDIHQSAQPWFYHDATYRLAALLPASHTTADVIFVLPLVTYSVLLLAVFALFLRLGRSNWIAALCTFGFFMIGSFAGSEKGIYAVSPSLVLGSLQMISIVLLIVLEQRKRSAAREVLIFILILWLSQTKLSTFLTIAGAGGVAALFWIRKQRRLSLILLGSAVCGVGVVVLQAFRPNPLMPGNDFIIGFPLWTYAHLVSKWTHLPLAEISPITTSSLSVRSLLILPYFLLHLVRWVVSDLRLLGFAISMLALWKYRLSIAPNIKALWQFGSVAIVMGFLLPVLYSPAWYPDALSFYTPLVSMQFGLLLCLSGAIVLWQHRRKRAQRYALYVTICLALLGIYQNIGFHVRDRSTVVNTVPASLVSALTYFQYHTQSHALLVTRRYDTRMIDTASESYYWYAAISGRPVVSEGARYGALLAATSTLDSAQGLHPVEAAQQLLKYRRGQLDTVYLSASPSSVITAMRTLHADYILEDGTIDQRLAIDPSQVAVLFYANNTCRIWKMKQPS